jgi:hypothetical protein
MPIHISSKYPHQHRSHITFSIDYSFSPETQPTFGLLNKLTMRLIDSFPKLVLASLKSQSVFLQTPFRDSLRQFYRFVPAGGALVFG